MENYLSYKILNLDCFKFVNNVATKLWMYLVLYILHAKHAWCIHANREAAAALDLRSERFYFFTEYNWINYFYLNVMLTT